MLTALLNLLPLIKNNILLVLSGTILVLLLSGYVYIKYESYVKSEYTTKIETLKNSVSALKTNFSNYINASTEVDKANTEINDARNKTKIQEDILNDKLDKLDSDLKTDSSSVESAVNAASKERKRCFELATGAIAVKNEKNSVCPEFIK